MFVLRVGIDQVHKLFSHFTKNQVVGDLGRWRFWWWWHCWWCWWFWWWFGGADFGDDDDQVMGLGSSGWWWLSPGDGSSGWPVGVLPVHDLWLWTSAPGKGFNTQLSINNVLIKCMYNDLILTTHPHTLCQGLNSGLVLFQLDKMRQSAEYNRQLNKTMMHELSNRCSSPQIVA